jgi:hypothetical protein
MDKSNSYSKQIMLLNCDYEHAARVKALGAKWHKDWRMWFIDQNVDKEPFKPWLFKEDK